MWRWHARRESEPGEVEKLRAQLDELYSVLRTLGAPSSSAAEDAVDGVAPGLIVASRVQAPRPGGEPVRITLGGGEVIAVVGCDGDPAAWQASVAGLAQVRRSCPGGAVRLEQHPLPAGLRAVVIPSDPGVSVITSARMDAGLRRQAVRVALGAARRAGWASRRLPPAAWVPLASGALLAAVRRLAAHASPVHAAIAAGSAAAAAGVTAAAMLLPAASVPLVSVTPVRPPAVHARRYRQRAPVSIPAVPRPVTVVTRSPSPRRSAPAAQAASSVPLPVASASASPSVPVPVSVSVSASVAPPSPSSSPSAPVKICVGLLGLKVCV